MEEPSLHLHTYFRSTCSARVRTAAFIKEIPLTYSYTHLLKDEQLSDEYRSINPSLSVPTLTITEKLAQGATRTSQIRQSVAILEFFEEAFPSRTPLLPPANDLIGRAYIRNMVNIIACDIQPPTNLRILKRIGELGGDKATWANDIMLEGLISFEQQAAPFAGDYVYGDQLTIADVVLAPAMENAIRYNVDLNSLPITMGIYSRIRVLEPFRRGDWKHQEDTPIELRSVGKSST